MKFFQRLAKRGAELRSRIPAGEWPVVVTLCVFAFLWYSAHSLSRWFRLLPAGYDLGIFHQAIAAYARFDAPLVALKGPHFNLLGDHFHPILATLAPLYWVWPDPRMLLFAHNALIVSSGVVVYAFMRRRCGQWTSTALTCGYLLAWPFQVAVNFDFHEIAFAVPLIAWAVDSIDRRAVRELLVASALLLLTREDMGILVVMFALVLALVSWRSDDRRRLWSWAGGLAGLGLVAYVVIVKVCLPALSPSGSFAYWSYGALGKDIPDAVTGILAHPGRAIGLFFTPEMKSATLAWLFFPLLCLPLFSPYVLLALPLLAQRFWSDRVLLWTADFHYQAPLWPILILAAIDGLERLGLLKHRVTAALLPASLLLTLVGGMILAPVQFPTRALLTGEGFAVSERMRDQRTAIAAIPPGTCVEADDRLIPRLLRTNRMTVPTRLGWAPDYVALDLTMTDPGGLSPVTAIAYRKQLLERGYHEVSRSRELVVLSKPDARASAQCKP